MTPTLRSREGADVPKTNWQLAYVTGLFDLKSDRADAEMTPIIAPVIVDYKREADSYYLTTAQRLPRRLFNCCLKTQGPGGVCLLLVDIC